MAFPFSILGRGRAGKSLAQAWGDHVQLLPHDARPEGLVLLAVPDGAIWDVASHFPGRCVHMSGSLHLDHVPCAHPLTSFNGTMGEWNGTPLALTGDVPELLVQSFQKIGFTPFRLAPELKPLYHACAVLSSGHAATLWLGAQSLLQEAGVSLPGRGLMALAEATLRNVEAHGVQGRTGPFVRGDESTIQRDAEALPEPWRELFLKLGRL